MPPAGTSTPPPSSRADRRQAIVDATVRVLSTEGLGAVSHRSVAREAGVALAATTYYFSSKDDLMKQALDALSRQEIAELKRYADDLEGRRSTPGELAAALTEVFAGKLGRGPKIARYEIYLEAARRPAHTGVVREWIAAFSELATVALGALDARDPGTRAELLVAGVDGILIQELAVSGRRFDDERLRRRFEELLRCLANA